MSRTKLVLFAALIALLALPAGSVFAMGHYDFSGTAAVKDDAALSDAITYTIRGVPNPSEGTEYVGWLISKSSKLSTGPMTVVGNAISHSFDSSNPRYTGENLIRNFNTISITEEAVGSNPDVPAGPAVYSYSVPLSAIAHIRNLVSDWPEGSGSGILTDLQAQLEVSIQHANKAKLAADAGDLDGTKKHLQRVIDSVNGDAGVLFYTANRKHAGLAAGTVLGDSVVNGHGGLVEAHGANAERWSISATVQAQKIIDTTDLSLARVLLGPGGNTVNSYLDAALNGNPLSGDGGAKQAYAESQLMATFTLRTGAPNEDEIGGVVVEEEVVVEGIRAPGSVGDPAVPVIVHLGLVIGLMLVVFGTAIVQRRRINVRV
jgi:hypothetical protein